jgi:sugar O-acyltransferase (sialic acid O-acetyltransferase NeuD family)
MAKVVIFGNRDTAELARIYLRDDSPHEVVAFAVNAEYRHGDDFQGLPLVDFEDIERRYPPDDHAFFVPMTGKGMNLPRAAIYRQAKDKGYGFVSYVSSRAAVYSQDIGENCLILENCVIQPRASLGDNVMLWSGNHIGHHSRVDSHNFLAGHVVVAGHCHVEPHCFLGARSTVRDGLRIAEGTFLAMASALTRATEPWRVYRGNPARGLRVDSRRFYS